jgi:hypothetical protein
MGYVSGAKLGDPPSTTASSARLQHGVARLAQGMEYFVEQQLHVVTEHQFRVVLPDTLEARTDLWARLAESGAWRPRPIEYGDTEEERGELAKYVAEQVLSDHPGQRECPGAKGKEVNFYVRPAYPEDVPDPADWDGAWKIIDMRNDRWRWQEPRRGLNSGEKWEAIDIDWSPMMRFAISEAAFEAINAMLPLESVLNEKGERLVWLHYNLVHDLRRKRRPGESFSDVILRLAEIEGWRLPSEWSPHSRQPQKSHMHEIEVGIAAIERDSIMQLGDWRFVPDERRHGKVKPAFAARTRRSGAGGGFSSKARTRRESRSESRRRSASAISASAFGSAAPRM